MANLKGSRTLATDTSALAQAFNRYIYVAYDASGNEVHRIYRYTTQPGSQPFNVITDSLATGTYTIFVVGSNDEIQVDNSDETTAYDPSYMNHFPLLPPNQYGYGQRAAVYVNNYLLPAPRSNEIFLGKTTVTVTNQDSQNNITVNRIVGQLEVNIEDAIPNNVAYLNVTRLGEFVAYSFYSDRPFGATELPDDDWESDLERDFLKSTDHGKTNYKTDRFVLNTLTPITVQITAYDINNTVIAQTTVNNVQMYKNKRTILTGKLFGPAQTQFSITANQAWDPNVTTIHF